MARDLGHLGFSSDTARRAGDPVGRPYAPYAVDWRFLPEDLLLVKDCVRHVLVEGSNAIARTAWLSGAWASTVGRGPGRAVRKAGVLFVHIPKTGGTSISKVLYRRNLPHYTARFWRNVFGARIADLPSFAVVRHPAERMLSAYRMALHGGTDIVAYSRYWRSRLQGLSSFESFVDFVFDHRAQPESLPLDLWPQGAFILDAGGAVMVDRLFSLDRRTGLPAELCHWLSVPSIPHLNATGPAPADVTPAVRGKIGRIYEHDFAIYDAVVARGGCADLRGRPFTAPQIS